MTHAIVGDLRSDVAEVMQQGEITRLRYYIGSRVSNDYDDSTILIRSGNDVWTSGVCLPIGGDKGNTSQEGILFEQGKIKANDSVIFIAGNVETSETMKIGLGSPSTEEMSVVPGGIVGVPSYGEPAFKKIYCRYITAGSLIGER